MTINEKLTIIRSALAQLGIGRKGDIISAENNHNEIGRILINGRYFGIFDFSRRTFVD